MLRHTVCFALPALTVGFYRALSSGEELPWLASLLGMLALGYLYCRALAFWTDLILCIPSWASIAAGTAWVVILLLANENAALLGEFRGPLDFAAPFFAPSLLGFIVARIANRLQERAAVYRQ